jgi:hypothetical protein
MALIEQQADLFYKVCAHMKQISGKAPTPEEAIAVYTSVHNWQMNYVISSQQDARQGTKEAKPKSDVKCKECGKFLTVGEKKYCDDADKAYRCYKCTKK